MEKVNKQMPQGRNKLGISDIPEDSKCGWVVVGKGERGRHRSDQAGPCHPEKVAWILF